jgi:hypothetical protein
MKLGKKIIALALFGMAISGFAGECRGKVKEIFTHHDERVLFKIADKTKRDECKKWIGVDASEEYKNKILSILLTAKSSGSALSVHFNDDNYPGNSNYHQFMYLYYR